MKRKFKLVEIYKGKTTVKVNEFQLEQYKENGWKLKAKKKAAAKPKESDGEKKPEASANSEDKK